MRPAYIFILPLVLAAALHGCGCSDLPDMRQPNTLSSRVGNFSPARIDSDKAEIRAAKKVTPLPKGSRDLDGQEKDFDPAFGWPDQTTANLVGNGSNPAIANTDAKNPQTTSVQRTGTELGGGSRFGEPGVDAANQSLRFDQIAAGQVETALPGTSEIVVKPADSSRFGLGEGGSAPASFAPTGASTPISDLPSGRGSGTPQGIGCPPSGMASLGNNLMRQGGFVSTAPITAPGAESAPYAQFSSIRPLPPSPGQTSQYAQTPPASAAPAQVGDSGVIEAQTNRLKDVNVTFTARVKRVLPDDRKGSPHQRFLLELSNGTTVLVAHNIDLAPYIPLKEGDPVTISGEYIWNEKGGVVHYTHRPTSYRHRGGYIEHNRQIYQ